MDDIILFGRNKRKLREAKFKIDEFLKKEKLTIKNNWTIFKVDTRPIHFLGHKFYRGYTKMDDGNFLRVRRRIKKVSKKSCLNYKDASAILSYCGFIKHCKNFTFKDKFVRPYVSEKQCKEVVKDESRKRFKAFSKI